MSAPDDHLSSVYARSGNLGEPHPLCPIDPAGKVVKIEGQMSHNSLPPAAKSAIIKFAGGGRIVLVESVTKDNSIVAYEAHVKIAGRLSEIKVDPDG